MVFADALMEHIDRVIRADAARLDFDCGEALELTAPGMRHRIVIVEQPLTRFGPGSRFVACVLDRDPRPLRPMAAVPWRR